MTTLTRTCGTVIATIGLVVGSAGFAAATVVQAGGGTWDYGTTPLNVWSNYTHPTNCHSSSVATGGGSRVSSGPTSAGQTAFARVGKAPWDHGSSYWNNQC